MKFLTIGKIKDTIATIPAEERKKISVATLEYDIELKKKMGDKLHFYGVPGNDGMLVLIMEVDSVEELAQIYSQVPIVQTGFFKYESYPLIEADVNSFEARLVAVKAQ